jgi:hypothetical protein
MSGIENPPWRDHQSSATVPIRSQNSIAVSSDEDA